MSVIDKAIAFKFGMQLGFAKAHHENGCGPRLKKLPELWGFPFNVSATVDASDFKFSTRFGFAKLHH